MDHVGHVTLAQAIHDVAECATQDETQADAHCAAPGRQEQCVGCNQDAHSDADDDNDVAPTLKQAKRDTAILCVSKSQIRLKKAQRINGLRHHQVGFHPAFDGLVKCQRKHTHDERQRKLSNAFL